MAENFENNKNTDESIINWKDHVNAINLIEFSAQQDKIIQYVRDKKKSLGDLRLSAKTEPVCLAAIHTRYKNMEHVPENIMTYDFCRKAVQINGLTLKYIPEKFKSKEMCELAVKNTQGFGILRYLPYPDLCLQVLDRSIETGQIRKYVKMIRPEVFNAEIALKVVTHAPSCIGLIPDVVKTNDICMTALSKDASLLGFVPDDLKDKNICLEAISQEEYAITGIPESLKTPEFYKEAINVNPLCFSWIPDEFKTDELFHFSIHKRVEAGDELARVFQILDNPEQCLKMIKETDNLSVILDIVFQMDEKLMHKEIVLEAVTKHPACFAVLPEKFKSKDICELAVQGCPRMLNETPKEFRTPEMYLQVTKSGVTLIDAIPDHIISGKNIFSFSVLLEKKIQDDLSYKQIEALYHGNLVKISKVMTSSGLKENQWVKYNQEKNALDLWPVKDRQEIGSRRMSSSEKESRGKRMS